VKFVFVNHRTPRAPFTCAAQCMGRAFRNGMAAERSCALRSAHLVVAICTVDRTHNKRKLS
jgi:hypothetical protein